MDSLIHRFIRAPDKGGPRAQLLDGWMAGLAGGGISIYYAILCIEYV